MRLRQILAVIHMSRYVVQLLPERAAEGDVHLLEAAADAEHGHAGGDGARNQRQRGFVALRIMQRARFARFAPIVTRLDIRRAAHEHQPVESVEQLVQLQLPSDGRYQQRQTACNIEHRSDIFLAREVVRQFVLAKQAAVRRNADHRTLRTHETRVAPGVEAV